ncbi:MAG TPA: toll/interleukin-1 receptor domain-containing protein [Rubrivivax sp.]|nr:toll/interleukin-1 receptor domain-containing protein [Rubrivivax sp.]
MTDVFISYANSDRKRAQQLANALSGRGWSVWWDRNIKAGQAFDEVIERELEGAKNIVVLWSAASIASEWVKNEAAFAAQRGVLVPVLIDHVKVPLEFRRKQTADLVAWDGSPSHGALEALLDALTSERPPFAAAKETTPAPRPPQRQYRLAMASAVAGFLLGCLTTYLAVGYSAISEKGATSSPDPAAHGSKSPSPVSTKLPGLFAANVQGSQGALPTNLTTSHEGVFLDIIGFERAGELTTLEWTVRNTSDKGLVFCNHASNARLIDEVSGESWPALHTGGPAAGCENIPGGGRSGAWAKFKVPSLESGRLSLSLPSLHKPPQLPGPRVPSK